ncbi:hypothetical protein L211DRAFT_841123 [Terfezia boudieri ATCC MYA-4762]|uniref:Uncharacterized protein n=1 Tax=Terfezia boudieri ATCC MYA-4762 TaxID=1051890 RepID=A0A3N4LDL1_9PEZI|nr:hypothetical protein L211DRAFT_843913 [Terfezia boudieri ATCC MYA-4762]RPB20970.1 hypothetical protein L211DRAFT_841123 [Terfezia boudieri ATCC MYA-4762]
MAFHALPTSRTKARVPATSLFPSHTFHPAWPLSSPTPAGLNKPALPLASSNSGHSHIIWNVILPSRSSFLHREHGPTACLILIKLRTKRNGHSRNLP